MCMQAHSSDVGTLTAAKSDKWLHEQPMAEAPLRLNCVVVQPSVLHAEVF